MAKRSEVTNVRLNPENGVITTTIKLGEPIDPDLELQKIIEKNAEVLKLDFELIEAKEAAKTAKEDWEKASQELQKMISECEREYPLFDRNNS